MLEQSSVQNAWRAALLAVGCRLASIPPKWKRIAFLDAYIPMLQLISSGHITCVCIIANSSTYGPGAGDCQSAFGVSSPIRDPAGKSQARGRRRGEEEAGTRAPGQRIHDIMRLGRSLVRPEHQSACPRHQDAVPPAGCPHQQRGCHV